VESVAAFAWNGWQASSGISGNLGLEYAVFIGGALILLYDMRWVDSAITIGMASYILYLDLTEIGGTIRTLMLGSP